MTPDDNTVGLVLQGHVYIVVCYFESILILIHVFLLLLLSIALGELVLAEITPTALGRSSEMDVASHPSWARLPKCCFKLLMKI